MKIYRGPIIFDPYDFSPRRFYGFVATDEFHDDLHATGIPTKEDLEEKLAEGVKTAFLQALREKKFEELEIIGDMFRVKSKNNE